MPWPRLGEGGDRGINVPALPRCLGRRQNKEAIVRPTLSQRNPEPFQSQFALTMSSLFRDLYSIEADMLFEAKNNCSMTSKNAQGCQCQGQGGRSSIHSTNARSALGLRLVVVCRVSLASVAVAAAAVAVAFYLASQLLPSRPLSIWCLSAFFQNTFIC